MALTNKDLQAIQTLLLPVYDRLDKMDNRFDKMDDRLDKMDDQFDKMDDRLDKMDIRLDKLDSEVSSLKAGQLEIRKELKNIDRRVSDTYNLALDTWGTSTENRVWLESINPAKSEKRGRRKRRNTMTPRIQ